jgi:hypothetical protein
MKRFAKLGLNSKVVGGCAVEDAVAPDEATGIEFLIELTSYPFWKATTKNAGVGSAYDEDNDVFIEPKPHPSWVLNSTHEWEAPVAYPEDGKHYLWDEPNEAWVGGHSK